METLLIIVLAFIVGVTVVYIGGKIAQYLGVKFGTGQMKAYNKKALNRKQNKENTSGN